MNKIYLGEREPIPINIGGEVFYVTEIQYLKESIEKMIKEYTNKQKIENEQL